MANGKNEVSVSLRLTLEKLRADVQRAAAEMKAGLATGAKGVATDTDRAASSMDKLEAKTRKATSAIKDQKAAMLDAWRKSIPAPTVRGIGFDAPSSSAGADTPRVIKMTGSGLATSPNSIFGDLKAKVEEISNGKYRGYGMGAGRERGIWSNPMLPKGAGPGEFVPTPPKLPAPKHENPLGRGSGISGLAVSGIPYIGTIARAIMSPIGIAAVAVGASLLALRKAFDEMRVAAEQAKRTYATALRQGGGIGLAVTRSTMAAVMGVSEQEVEQYASTIESFNSRVAVANQLLVSTNPRLTGLAYSFGVLKVNGQALAATLTDVVAPAIQQFIQGLSELVSGVAQTINRYKSIITTAFEGLMNGILNIVVGPANAILAKLGIKGIAAAGGAPITPESPMASAHRMAASAFEKMGLVVGQGSQSPLKNIERYNFKMESHLAKIAEAVGIPRSGTPNFSVQSAP